MDKRALITGITGQDGSYLAELLIAKGYKVYGLIRRLSTPNFSRISHILSEVELIEADLLDEMSLVRALHHSQADEVYNLAAMSHVVTSFSQPVATADYNALGVVRLLEAIRMVSRPIRFYQASTSEMFGRVSTEKQNESTPFHPRSPYGVAKLYAHWIVRNYRESYGMYASSGILFNHESPRRGHDFVTRKITRAVARIYLGDQQELKLGNLEARRDWGFAGDYVEAMWLMLQAYPDDYVIATGETHSVCEFAQVAFSYVGLNWRDHVYVDESLYRPCEVDTLCGNASKARRVLAWEPTVKFPELVAMMVDADIQECLIDATTSREKEAYELEIGEEHRTLLRA